MAIFTAGCIELTKDAKKIRNSVYALAKHDLDSTAMKISLRKSPTCINFIAFLPKDKIVYENILKKVSECESKTVIIFELDYKHVGVVCEYKRIVDYILDKPKEFAKERGYKSVFVDNAQGVKLVSFNLDNNSRETKAGFLSLGFTILLTTTIFFSGYTYMQDTKINRANHDSLAKQYKEIVKKKFNTATLITKKIDIVGALNDVERLTKATHARLRQVKYENNSFCIEIKTLQMIPFLKMLPQNAKIVHRDNLNGIVKYCYEEI